jgi:hypothetical protein
MSAAAPKRQRAINASGEEVSAGPVIDPDWTPLSPLSQGSEEFSRKRAQRIGGISVESYGSSADPDYLDYEYRCGGPVLCRVPGFNTRLEEGDPAYSKSRYLEKSAWELSENAGIQDIISVVLSKRGWGKASTSTYLPTILIGTRNTAHSSHQWYRAFANIRNFLQDEGCQHVNVEIADPRAENPPRCSMILPDDEILNFWPQVKPEILEVLGDEGWLTLDVMRFGCDEDVFKNDVTILVTKSESSSKNWTSVLEGILRMIDVYPALKSVAVRILIGKPDTDSPMAQYGVDGWDRVRVALCQEATLGSSMGRFNDRSSVGTFGGLIQLQDQRTREWKTYGLTCFHCVIPSDIDQKDAKGTYILPEVQRTGKIYPLHFEA